MKKNCWEFKECGRELNGKNVAELGVCPVYEDYKFNGINEGKASGRACWLIAGTFCKGEIQGSFSKKMFACLECDFFEKVMEEEGDDFLLVPAGEESATIMRFYRKLRETNLKLNAKNEEIIKMQKELIKNEHLKAVNAIVITYNHEILNPLTTAFGFVKLAKKELEDDGQSAAIKNIENSLERINSIVKSISDISKNPEIKFENYIDDEDSMISIKKTHSKK